MTLPAKREITERDMLAALDRTKPPFVPDEEGDGPGPDWFTGDWPKRAYEYQRSRGYLQMAGSMMEPTYACGHIVATLVTGTPEQQNAQYWRSVRFACPACQGKRVPAPAPFAKPGHLNDDAETDGELDFTAVTNTHYQRGANRTCTMVRPCCYACWLERNARLAEDYLREHPLVHDRFAKAMDEKITQTIEDDVTGVIEGEIV